MDRVQGVSETQAPWLTRQIYRALKKRIGRLPKGKTLMAHHTPTLLATTWMDAVCASPRAVPAVLLELAQLKVAALVGCVF